MNTTNFTPKTQHLRHLTVYVDEPDPGHYYWVLIESLDDSSVWNELEGSEESYDTWLDAHKAGNTALLDLVDDKATGPLAEGEDENASPVG